MFARCTAHTGIAVLLAVGGSLIVNGSRGLSAADFYQTNFHSLADFRFEGVRLGGNAAQLKHRFPEAQFAYDKTDAKVGITAYAVGETKTADSACFYFQHDQLFQIDIEYKKPRVEQFGGAGVITDSLMASMGPPDYADFFRRTWYQPACRCRADFWVTDDCGMLVITDTSRAPRADDRLHTARSEAALDLGFEGRVRQASK